jgi:AcrR family transcriptional regulator
VRADEEAVAGEAAPRRDAARTRKALLDAASRRFAQDGYASTTVRDIADDAGVNVALINRYFGSKEGLFEACLMNLVEESRQEPSSGPDRIAESIADLIAGPRGEHGHREFLPLLLRRSGDERIDELRLNFLRYYTERLAASAGWERDKPDSDADADQMLLRAQLVLAASIGGVVFRAAGLEPLATVGEDELVTPLRDLVDALLLRRREP